MVLQAKKVEILSKLEEATLAEKGSQKVAQEVAALQRDTALQEAGNVGLLKDLDNLKVSDA